jgi:hypothetical protein
LAGALSVALCGCGGPPPATPVEATVLLDGQPLPRAKVQFLPDLPGQEAKLGSSAVTDDNGRCTLRFDAKDEAGAVVGKHRVVVTEAPPPAEFRGMSQKAQEGYARYRKGLKNRPIPEAYGSAVNTPLIVEVTPTQKEYTLNLNRRGQ